MPRIQSLTLAVAAAGAFMAALGAAPAAAAPLRAVPVKTSIDLPSRLATPLALPSRGARGFSPFVIGGTPAVDGTLLSTVYVEVRYADGGTAACTGSVIAPTFVVTAAHCFVSESKVTQVAIAAGAHDLSLVTSGVGEVIPGSHVEIDPDYNPDTAAHDAAVITLSRPTSAPPVPLATPDEIHTLGPQTPLAIAGWGLTTGSGSGDPPSQLQTAQVQLQDASYCSKVLGKLNVFDPSLFLCTDTPGHVAGTCHGDSGGPLLWTNPAGVVELIGLTDWGFDKCVPAISAYTNLGTVGPWVLFAAGLGPEPPRTSPPPSHDRPRPTSRPHISGSAVPGGFLTCHLGSWTGRPTAFAIDWLYNGKRVDGVHSMRVRLSESVHGGWARCAVTAVNAAGKSQSSSKGVHVRHLGGGTSTTRA
jgi:hypothetical protein